jgi:16S rRNA (cytosine967-C5)-methyltransferase
MPSPARSAAFDVVRRVFEEGAYADRALRREGLDQRDAQLATALAYGTIQRRGTLDHVIGILADRRPEKLDPPVLAALRLGLFQIGWMGGVADHAAVDESVELAKRAGRGHGLVNAVLRRATRELPEILAALTDDTPEAAAVMHSHPEWIVRLWWDALGPEETRALLARDNEPAESAIRIGAHDHRVLDAPVDVMGSEEFKRGEITPQSRASMLVSHVVDPQPGERILELCAAPGAKTTHLAALMGNEGEIVAVERNAQRAGALRAMAERMRATIVRVEEGDARESREGFDRVLADPPCSALGTLQSRPDARWRERDVDGLVALQAEILNAAAHATRPGGVLVYSTCTISPAENEGQMQAFLARHGDFTAEDLRPAWPLWEHPSVPGFLQTLPHRDHTDGFFIARLRRAGA